MKQKLLSIGVPTFNRASYLDQCLGYILPQTSEFKDDIEIIVADNASKDYTSDIINKYRNLGYEIKYLRHTENLGMDGNFISIYEESSGKYLWQISDDDFVIQGGLNRIIKILKTKEDIGVIYINNLWFHNEIDNNKFNHELATKYTIYNDPLKYIERVNYWVTFLSANIVNKNILSDSINVHEFKGSSLALLSWTLRSALAANENIVIENPILACRVGGQGGYKFAEVFSKNFDSILQQIVSENNPAEIRTIINNKLIRNYFPQFVVSKRRKKLTLFNYENENWFFTFFKCYKNYASYYFYLLPAFLLPTKLYGKYIRIVNPN